MALKEKFLRFALVLIFLAFAAEAYAASYAFSMNPGSVYLDFEPSMEKTISFYLTSSEDFPQEVELSAGASPWQTTALNVIEDLGRYASFPETRIHLGPHEKKQVSFMLKLPEKIDFGVHRGKVTAKQVAAAGHGLGTSTAVIFQVFVTRPFLGKYGEIKNVQISSGAAGQPVDFSISFWNLGAEAISSARAQLLITDSAGKSLASFYSTAAEHVESGKIAELSAAMDTMELGEGLYLATTTVFYDGFETEKFTKGFRLFAITLDILGIEPDALAAGQRSEVSVKLRNRWRESLTDIYAEFDLLGNGAALSSCGTEQKEISAHSEGSLSCSIVVPTFGTGPYKLRATVHYNGTETYAEEDVAVSASPPAPNPFTGFFGLLAGSTRLLASSPLMLALLAAAILMLLAGAALYVKKRRGRNPFCFR